MLGQLQPLIDALDTLAAEYSPAEQAAIADYLRRVLSVHDTFAASGESGA